MTAPASFILKTTAFRAGVLAMLVLVAAAGLVVTAVVWHTNAAMTRSTMAAIERDIAVLRTEHEKGGAPALLQAVKDRVRLGEGVLLRLADASGRLLAGNVLEQPRFEGRGFSGGTFHYSGTPDAAANSRLGAGRLVGLDHGVTLLVARDVEEQRLFLSSVNASLTIGLGALALIGLIAAVALARYILARVDAMSAASQAIMAGNLASRLPSNGNGDELDRLAASLNAMLERIERLVSGLKEVSDNIAHDLKTPLNRLRNRAESALADARGGEVWREGLEHTIEEADTIIKTFNALLLVARLEAGALDDDLEPVSLAPLVEDLAELYEPAAEEAGLQLTWSCGPVGKVRANRQLIVQAVANLVENAIKYGRPPAGGKGAVHVTLTAATGAAEIVVGDRGAGIAEADRERAIRRFVRLESSRSAPGTGLGLSLVAAVAQLHGGSLRLEDNAPGLRAVLSLPMMSPES